MYTYHLISIDIANRMFKERKREWIEIIDEIDEDVQRIIIKRNKCRRSNSPPRRPASTPISRPPRRPASGPISRPPGRPASGPISRPPGRPESTRPLMDLPTDMEEYKMLIKHYSMKNALPLKYNACRSGL